MNATNPTTSIAEIDSEISDLIEREISRDDIHSEDCEIVTKWEDRSCSCSTSNDTEQALIDLSWHMPDCDLAQDTEKPDCSCSAGDDIALDSAPEAARAVRERVVEPLLARIAKLEEEKANVQTLIDAILAMVAAVDHLKEKKEAPSAEAPTETPEAPAEPA